MVERSPVHAPLPIARLAESRPLPSPLSPCPVPEPFPRSVASRNDRLTVDTGLTMRRAPCHCCEPREREPALPLLGRRDAFVLLPSHPTLSLSLSLLRSLFWMHRLLSSSRTFCSTSRGIQSSVSNLIGRALFKGIRRIPPRSMSYRTSSPRSLVHVSPEFAIIRRKIISSISRAALRFALLIPVF